MTDLINEMITSTAHADGRLVVELVEAPMPEPKAGEVLIEIEATPINPSDMGLMFGAANLSEAEYGERRIVAPLSPGMVAAMGKRLGRAMPVGGEGAGRVIAAGDSAEAQALLGKRVACMPEGTYARYSVAEHSACIALPDDVTAIEGAAAFANPLTALGFVETMKRDGCSALIHTAAASNLGQMLLRICLEDGIDIINIVRSEEQVRLLRDIGAKHVLDMTAPDYKDRLVEAITLTGAYVAFDPIGGGNHMGRILSAMEKVASRDEGFSRYGSETMKRGYIYGLLDGGPIVIDRFFGFNWSVSGWLLFPFLQTVGTDVRQRMQSRIAANLKTTFASHYSQHVSLREMLSRDAVMAYGARRTGEKFLVLPQT